LKGHLRLIIIISCFLVFISVTLIADDYKYVSSKYSVVYHRPTCKKALRIDPRMRVTFKTAKEALDAGKQPCSVCKPPTTDKDEETKVRGF